MTTTNKTIEKTIVAFHIGRGGRFNNSGYKTFIGFKDFQDLINLNDNQVFSSDRDEQGRFCKPYLQGINGSFVTDDDINAKTGRLNFDNDYNTDYAEYLGDCSEHEHELIYKSDITTDDVKEWIVDHYTDPKTQLIVVDWIEVAEEEEN